jgi:hypothetical protein
MGAKRLVSAIDECYKRWADEFVRCKCRGTATRTSSNIIARQHLLLSTIRSVQRGNAHRVSLSCYSTEVFAPRANVLEARPVAAGSPILPESAVNGPFCGFPTDMPDRRDTKPIGSCRSKANGYSVFHARRDCAPIGDSWMVRNARTSNVNEQWPNNLEPINSGA